MSVKELSPSLDLGFSLPNPLSHVVTRTSLHISTKYGFCESL